jgi:hypothetical protein
MDAFPDLDTLSDEDLRRLIDERQQEEEGLSLRRRVLHGEIDLLHAEVQARLRAREGEGTGHLSEIDVQNLAGILAHQGPPTELPGELDELD